MGFETIEYSVADGVAKLVLNRPDSLNSFNETMHGEVRAALKDLSADDTVRCLLITGSGRGFCAGQDLSDRQVKPGDEPPDLGKTLEKHYNPLIRNLRNLEMPVVCAVNGVAAGAGASIAFACDLVIAARSAKFIQAFCKVGLLPDSGGTWILPRLVGHARAMALAMLGEPVKAEQAEAWGVIYKCVDDDALEQEANRLTSYLARQPTKGLALIKRAINAAYSNTLDEHLDLERDSQRVLGRTADYQEGVAAFLEKREADFKGR
ncbi:MAG: 2-(1,2-epoxy-1,2-dihydrophenyl)acetyl-CoA isomerase PaaG [Gammaproteobacteria bacterium]